MQNFFKKFQSIISVCTRQISTTFQNLQRGEYIDAKRKIIYGGDLHVPTPKESLGRVLFNRMLRLDRRNEILQICEATQKTVTTKSFLEKTVAVAEKLAEEGTKKGDFILLVGDNSLNMNVALVGILYLGAVPVPLSYKSDMEELQNILRSIKPIYFGCEKKYLFIFRKLLTDMTTFDSSKIFLLDQERDPLWPNVIGFEDFINGRGRDFESFQPAEVKDPTTELALAMKALTDGVLGRLVALTHHNLNSVIARYDAIDDGVLMRQKVFLMVQKVLWMSGIYALIISCAFGSKLVVMRQFGEEAFLRAIHQYKVTNTHLFSSKWWQLFKHTPSREYDLSSCTSAINTDGSLPKVLTDGLKEKIGLTMLPSYGITEMTGLVLKPSGKNQKEGCVGKLVPQVYGKVVSIETAQNVGPRETGELCFKGPVVTPGYLNNKRATQNLFDKEGYLLSGQYGYYEETGDFFIIDKIIHQIMYKSHKISPKELEGIIKSLDMVKDACVSGIPHPIYGEYPVAFVVLQKGRELTEADIIKYVDDRVPDHKKLRGGVIFLRKIPRFRETGSIKRNLFKKILSKYSVKVTHRSCLGARRPKISQDLTRKMSSTPDDLGSSHPKG